MPFAQIGSHREKLALLSGAQLLASREGEEGEEGEEGGEGGEGEEGEGGEVYEEYAPPIRGVRSGGPSELEADAEEADAEEEDADDCVDDYVPF